LTVKSSKLSTVGGLVPSKPDPFAEISVDGQPPRKTDILKKTLTPKWDEDFTL
jgi:Ca2+-dependent lipid-binding protein